MRRTLIVLALVGALFAGCGGDDDEPETAATPEATATAESGGSSSGGGGETVEVAAPESGALEFDPDTLTAKAGSVTFKFSNPSSVPHAFEIEGVEGAETETITGGDAEVTVDLEAGDYEFYCPVAGHEAAGMKGTLTVQ